MKYNIKDLINEFKNLGGSIDAYGFPVIPDYDDFGESIIASNFQIHEQNRKECIEKLKTASPEERKSLEIKYRAEQQALRDEIDKLSLNQNSNKARAIYDLIKQAELLHKIGIDTTKDIDKNKLLKLFTELGGQVENSSYTIPETPETIKQIEGEIKALEKECFEASDPFTLYDEDSKKVSKYQLSLIEKIDDLKAALKAEIKNNPDYNKVRTIMESISVIDKLENYQLQQKTFGE